MGVADDQFGNPAQRGAVLAALTSAVNNSRAAAATCSRTPFSQYQACSRVKMPVPPSMSQCIKIFQAALFLGGEGDGTGGGEKLTTRKLHGFFFLQGTSLQQFSKRGLGSPCRPGRRRASGNCGCSAPVFGSWAPRFDRSADGQDAAEPDYLRLRCRRARAWTATQRMLPVLRGSGEHANPAKLFETLRFSVSPPVNPITACSRGQIRDSFNRPITCSIVNEPKSSPNKSQPSHTGSVILLGSQRQTRMCFSPGGFSH